MYHVSSRNIMMRSSGLVYFSITQSEIISEFKTIGIETFIFSKLDQKHISREVFLPKKLDFTTLY